jgi:hypothetical protein
VAVVALLLGAQEQVQTAMAEAEASVVRDMLTADVVMNAIPILDESETTWTIKFNVKKYWTKKVFHHVNSFCKLRGKWVQHAKDILNMAPLYHLLIGIVSILLRETLFTKHNWEQAGDMNHGLNLGGIEVIRSAERTKKGAMCLFWPLGTVKDNQCAIEREMKTKVP